MQDGSILPGNEAVSYTHLDVYKRQVIDSATAGIDESDFSLNDTRKIKMEILARMGRCV